MGYTTYFKGKIEIDKELDNDTYNLLTGLANTRRVKRNVEGYGVEGEFFIEEDDESIIDYNTPPATQPSLWLQWIPSEDKKSIVWDGGEKFYESVKWMEYIINVILQPRGYVLNGKIKAQGQDLNDRWNLKVKNNKVKVKYK